MSRTRSTLPHSWSLASWPDGVWPHSTHKARYTVRAHKDELIAAGALSRVGREIIVLGDRYSRWLEKQTANVSDYECPANRVRGESAAAEMGQHKPPGYECAANRVRGAA